MSLCSPQPGEGFVPSQNSSLCSEQQGSSSQSRGVWLSQASRGGLLSQAVLPWREASSGRQLPGMLPGCMWGWQLCYLLALTKLQLSKASKRNPAAAARPPTHCPQPGKGTFHGFMALVHGAEPGLLSSLHSQPPQHKVSTLTSNREEMWAWPNDGARHKSCFNLDAGLPLVLDIWLVKPYIPDSSF